MKRLGERIKKRREYLKMQLNDLARKVGISPSALSQIEKAKAFPSITTLKSISEHLITTVGELIGENETLNKNPLITSKEKKFVLENGSGASLYLLSHHDPGKQMETYFVELKPNAVTHDFMTTHPGQEFLFVISGKIKIDLDGHEYLLQKGDSFYFNSVITHLVMNIHPGKSELLWIITPPNI
ncbi:MAG: helix-turn-helix transcriptional regulator [Bacteroidales bacterium]|nr:helix-turn-helix transcriptional regulator [Bacteroidales bacterium]